jgi:hypothetical protein
MKIINFSEPTTILGERNPDPINVFYQYYVDGNRDRAEEIKQCLRFNAENSCVDNIYLLNERYYSLAEMGLSEVNPKIKQFNLSKRLEYGDVFQYILDNNIKGYNVIINSDILLDDTIDNLHYSDIHLNKKMFALLRYELNAKDIKQSKLFGPMFDSQDTWIIHSNFNIAAEQVKVFNFQFGKPGCDNKLVYLMNILGYTIVNDPYLIKTYHYHSSQVRSYTNKDRIQNPYGLVVPASIHYTSFNPSLGIDFTALYTETRQFKEINFEDNDVLFNYIAKQFELNKPFVIPRIAGVENNYACIGELIQHNPPSQNHLDYVAQTIASMKVNAGIKLPTYQTIIKYSKMYMNSFQNCDIYFGWESQGNYMPHISASYQYFKEKYNKPIVWTMALDIFHYIFLKPWTLALKGKKVLIVSAFEKSIQEKIPIRTKIYGIDLFPDCEITTICPPQTQGSEPSDAFDVELKRFTDKLDGLDYDIALVSCGGYGNLVCDYIFQQGKSAIYVGGVLQMYFGILGNRWIKERPEVVQLFLNEYWTRPKETERPNGHDKVEKSCYW